VFSCGIQSAPRQGVRNPDQIISTCDANVDMWSCFDSANDEAGSPDDESQTNCRL